MAALVNTHGFINETPSAATRRFAHIDALRGLAVLGVIAVHAAVVLAPGMPWRVSQFVSLGSFGVQLFFMVSAYTLAISWHSKHDYNFRRRMRDFWIRRVFRIAPMFWLAILIYSALSAITPSPFWVSGEVSPNKILLTAMFSHGWTPETINVVVPGGWSIGVEFSFYLLFPLLAFAIRGIVPALVFFVLSVALAPFANSVAAAIFADSLHLPQFLHWWLPNQMPAFATGLLLFEVEAKVRNASPQARSRLRPWLFLLTLAGLLVAAYAGLPYSITLDQPFPWRDLPANVAFAAFALALSIKPIRLIVNSVTCWLGKISFSAYLVHFLFIELALRAIGPLPFQGMTQVTAYIVYTAVIVGLTGLLAALTFRFIEHPCIIAGGRLVKMAWVSLPVHQSPFEKVDGRSKF